MPFAVTDGIGVIVEASVLEFIVGAGVDVEVGSLMVEDVTSDIDLKKGGGVKPSGGGIIEIVEEGGGGLPPPQSSKAIHGVSLSSRAGIVAAADKMHRDSKGTETY